MSGTKPMTADYEERLRGYLSGDLHSEPPWDGRDGMECALGHVLGAHDYWRARSPVTAEDVRERGISFEKALAVWGEHNTEEPDVEDGMTDDDKVAAMCNATADQWAALASYAADCAEDDEDEAPRQHAKPKAQPSLFGEGNG